MYTLDFAIQLLVCYVFISLRKVEGRGVAARNQHFSLPEKKHLIRTRKLPVLQLMGDRFLFLFSGPAGEYALRLLKQTGAGGIFLNFCWE
jgi:hypothetical protein